MSHFTRRFEVKLRRVVTVLVVKLREPVGAKLPDGWTKVATGPGEELFFRGLIGGWLEQRTKLGAANVIQAAIFILPHPLLLAVGLRLGPIALAFPFLFGLMVGWLRLKSGGIVPGWIVHGSSNTFSAIAMVST